MEMDGAPGAEKSPEDSVIDQIGELMAQLPPEKQAAVLEQLAGLLGEGAEPAPQEQPQQTVSMEGGTRGKPVGF
jgi:hypothetical protein